jgi:hypothetical protein
MASYDSLVVFFFNIQLSMPMLIFDLLHAAKT